MDPSRRGFLTGLITSVSGAGLLVSTSGTDLSTFVSGAPVTIAEPSAPNAILPGQTLYNELGQAVAIVDKVNFNRQHIEVTRWGGSSNEYIQGLDCIEIRARGLNFRNLGAPTKCSFCGSIRPSLSPCRQCGAGRA